MFAPATRLLNALSLITVVHLASTGHVYELTSPPGIVPSCDPTGNGAGAADCLENQPDATVAADSGSTLKTVLVVVVAVLTIFAIACACFLRHRYTTMVQYHKLREMADFDVDNDNCLEMDELEGSDSSAA